MLEFSKIDKDFNVYKNNDVYLFGASKAGIKVKEILEKNGVHIKGFIDNNELKHGTEFCGINVFSFSDYLKVSKDTTSTLIQISSTFEKEIITQLENNKIYNYITYTEFSIRIRQLGRYLVSRENQKLKEWFYECDWCDRILTNMMEINNFYFEKKGLTGESILNLNCAPPKTGNSTIVSSLNYYWKDPVSLQHSLKFLDKKLYNILQNEKIRMIIGIREPIKQNISVMFQITDSELWDLDEFWDGGGNVQEIFDNYIISKSSKKCWYNILKEKIHYNYLVQDFFKQQLEAFFGIDIYKMAFDKQSGYSIYKFDNIEIFIYQVEKLSKIFRKLSGFLKAGNIQIILDNTAEEKWYNKQYKKAQKNIVLSKEYFEACYTEKYIKHFYSDEDIMRFKDIWKNNIQNNL